VEQAKVYLKRHESEMEERLAQSKTFSSRIRQAQLWLIKLAVVTFVRMDFVLTDTVAEN
jgi:hypothetical protein